MPPATARAAVTIDMADEGSLLRIDFTPIPVEGTLRHVIQDVTHRLTAVVLDPTNACRRALPGTGRLADSITVAVPWMAPILVARVPFPGRPANL